MLEAGLIPVCTAKHHASLTKAPNLYSAQDASVCSAGGPNSVLSGGHGPALGRPPQTQV